ncbi:MAG: hydantoinase/oxoprolinase family protein [Thermoplasmata archaeon]
MMRIGIDIGGAFTDLVGYDEKGNKIVWIKTETTPDDPSRGVIEAIKKSRIDMSKVVTIVGHGQTAVINSIITRNGAKVGLITTEGYRDVLLLQRANRRDIYNFAYKKPAPFVPRYLTMEVKERIRSDGAVMEHLDRKGLENAVRALKNEKVESICVSFINSYVNPIHELEARDIIRNIQKEEWDENVPITLSHEITREWGEYERTNTAVLNAFVKPKMRAYLTKLENEIKEMGFKGQFFAILSNGGIASFDFAKEYPIYSVESGPIAGVIGGISVAELLGEGNIIVIDGGSTTTKASLVENLVQKVNSEYHIGKGRFYPGYPLRVPVTDIEEVGNGGTSIAWVDDIGNLKVGPTAAGAYPGPVCYGRGGKEPTVTDAYVVNGLINPNYLLGGEMKIYRDAAVKAIKRKIADYYNISVEEAADGIIKIANENAANTIRIISVQRGYDPRDFTLVAHGGSGPMFAPFIAQDLEINKIVIPSIPPGVFSAWGMLLTNLRHDLIATNVMTVSERAVESVNETFRDLDEKIVAIFERNEKVPRAEVSILHYADMRYKGQEHAVKVPIEEEVIGPGDLGNIIERFHSYHEREYSFRLQNSQVEITNFHVVGVSKVEKPVMKELDGGFFSGKIVKEYRKVFLNGMSKELPVYDRRNIRPNTDFEGPAIIEDPTSTVLVLEGQVFSNDNFGNIIIRNGGR